MHCRLSVQRDPRVRPLGAEKHIVAVSDRQSRADRRRHAGGIAAQATRSWMLTQVG
jgi:hypothetical protein